VSEAPAVAAAAPRIPFDWVCTPEGMSRDGGVPAISGVWFALDVDGLVVAFNPPTGEQAGPEVELDGDTVQHLGDAGLLFTVGYEQMSALTDLIAGLAALGPHPDFHAQLEVFLAGEVRHRGSVDGGTFIFDIPSGVPAVWGRDRHVLWSRGEPLMIAGPQGVGKTTDLGQLAFGLAGVPGFEELYGFPVVPLTEGRRVLYLALDRPEQIARALRRMAPLEHRALIAERIEFWRGPLPFDIKKEPTTYLSEWAAREYDAGAILVDSLKDVVPGLSNEEVAAHWNSIVQVCIADGIEVASAHHNRKANADNRRPKTLADIHGSENLQRGHGSIICLYGAAGDEEIEFIHLKQPAETVDTFVLRRDHETGRSVRDRDGKLPTSAAAETARALRHWFMQQAVGQRRSQPEIQAALSWGKTKTHDALLAATISGFLIYAEGGGAGNPSTWERAPLERIPEAVDGNANIQNWQVGAYTLHHHNLFAGGKPAHLYLIHDAAGAEVGRYGSRAEADAALEALDA
jgi:hypothetical protein